MKSPRASHHDEGKWVSKSPHISHHTQRLPKLLQIYCVFIYPIVYTNVKNFQDYNLLRYKPTISFRTNQAWGYVRKIITNLVINIV